MSEPHEILCSEAVELLPWLLNGSLEAGEQRTIRDHLKRCESCRRELEATALAAEIFTRHIPSLALAEYAHGLTPGEVGQTRLEQHLAWCPSCREELDRVMADRVADFESARAARQAADRHRSPWRRRLAMAAGLILALTTGLLWNERTSPGESSEDVPTSSSTSVERTAEDQPDQGSSPTELDVLFQDGFEAGTTSAWSS